MRRLLSFPNPVNEVSARLVAGGVVLMVLAALATREPWLLLVIAYGFVARVVTGPTLSPLGMMVTKVLTPRLGLVERPVPGPPSASPRGSARCSRSPPPGCGISPGHTGPRGR